MSFLHNVSALMLNRLSCAGLGVTISALSARLLSPAELGSLVATTASIALLMRIASIGLGQSAQFYGARESREKEFFGYALLMAIAPIAIASLIVVICMGSIIGGLILKDDPLAQGVFRMLKYGIPLTGVHLLASLYCLGKRNMKSYYLLSIVPLISTAVILVWAMVAKKGLPTVVFAWLAQYLISFILGLYFLAKRNQNPTGSLKRSVYKLYNYGARSFMVFTVAFAVTHISLVISMWFTTNTEVGVFAVGRIFADGLLLVYGAIGPLIFSYVGNMDDYEIVHAFVGRACRLSLVLFSGLSVLIAVAAPIGMPLVFGKEYTSGYLIVWILLPGLVFLTVQRILENYLYGRSKQGLLVFSHVVTIITFVVGASSFAPRLGGQGLAMASSISCMTSLVLTSLIAYWSDGLNIINLLVPRSSDFRFLVGRVRHLEIEIRQRFGR